MCHFKVTMCNAWHMYHVLITTVLQLCGSRSASENDVQKHVMNLSSLLALLRTWKHLKENRRH
jgi:hypothetical protein